MIFGTFCAAMTVHAFFMYPETAKKSLEEIDLMFDEDVPAWHSAKVATFQDKVAEVKRTGGIIEAKNVEAAHEEQV